MASLSVGAVLAEYKGPVTMRWANALTADIIATGVLLEGRGLDTTAVNLKFSVACRHYTVSI